jgi:hypothetical protein
VKGITIRQPWVELILQGRKPYEIRSWGTSYRGPILLHAAKALDKSALFALEIDASSLFRGGFVGRAELKRLSSIHASRREGLAGKRRIRREMERGSFRVGTCQCVQAVRSCAFRGARGYLPCLSESFAKFRGSFLTLD